MGSLSQGGLPLTQPTNQLRHSHNGNYVRESNTITDVKSAQISNSGTISLNNLTLPFGIEHSPSQSRVFISGMPLILRDLQHNPAAASILALEHDKFVNDSGNLKHVVTRAMGIHTSISDRQSSNGALGPMVARTERKVFFLDSDTDKTSGFSAWEIFDGSGCPVGATNGITDTDITPGPTFDEPC